MSIILKEQNLLHKSLLYATDLNPDVLEKARSGFFPLQMMQAYSSNYVQSGGMHDFSSYYRAESQHAKFDEDLMKKIIFSTHNLVSDRSFNSFDLIICRNVLIYFDNHLQERVLQLFDDSLEKLGFLALGSKENLRFTSVGYKFRQEGREKIWRKIH